MVLHFEFFKINIFLKFGSKNVVKVLIRDRLWAFADFQIM